MMWKGEILRKTHASTAIASSMLDLIGQKGMQGGGERRRKVRITSESSKLTETYQWGHHGKLQYRVSFAFGRFNPNSTSQGRAYKQNLKNIIPEALQPFADATIYMNETGYWLGKNSSLSKPWEARDVGYGVFGEELKEGKYVFVCGIYWHDQSNRAQRPRRLTLRHSKVAVGQTRELQMTHQWGENFLVGVVSRSYQSYREALGYWTCGTPELDMGEIRLVDVSPERLKPCTGNANNYTQGHAPLEKGEPLQIDLSSSQTLATRVQYAFTTWHFNVSQWLVKSYYPICAEYTLNQVRSVYQWLAPRDGRTQNEVHAGRLFLRSNRKRRDIFSTILGGIGAGMGVVNGVDIDLLRNKLSAIASDSKQGFVAQREINDILDNIQQRHIDTQVKVAQDFIRHFKRLVDSVVTQGKNMSWALACTQGQAELSTNIKLIVQSLYGGQWPYELSSQLSKILPKHISYTNPSWWSNAWIGCTNLDYE
ncbi:uncharacterized protein [Aquarana catesbeiana]|uniref:uncharacterized protein n=1 Tax=Aquarana catesbeiana TaxID=8400 RepID=UPI003CCA67C8